MKNVSPNGRRVAYGWSEKKTIAVFLLLFLLSFTNACIAQNSFELDWPLTSNATPVSSDILTPNDMNLGSSLNSATYNATNGLSSGGWSNDAGSLRTNEYYEFSVTNSGNCVRAQVKGVSFEHSRSNGNWVTAVFYSFNNFTDAFQLGSNGAVGTGTPTLVSYNSDLTIPQNGTLSFRVYAWESDGPNRSYRVRNFAMTGIFIENSGIVPVASSSSVCVNDNVVLSGPLVASGTGNSAVNASQSFDAAGWSYTTSGSGGTAGTSGSNVGGTGSPSNASFGQSGNGYRVSNSRRVLRFSNQTGLAHLRSKYIGFSLASLSLNSTTNGAEFSDSVTVAISTDGGVTFNEVIQVTGNSNSRWSYSSGTARAEVILDGDNSPSVFTPSSSDLATIDGYSSVRIQLPDNVDQVQVKIILLNSSSNEVWAVDNVALFGTTPSYTWTSSPAGLNSTLQSVTVSPNFTTTYQLNSNIDGCTSLQSVIVNVSSPVTPSISITSNDADNSICSGSLVMFSSSITNGGPSPTYQWRLNGSPIFGANASSFTTSILNNGDVISCQLTSNAGCISSANVTSNSINTIVTNAVTPSVAVTSSDADNSICAGTSVTFTAAPTNGGTTPAYQWKLNGTNVGTNATTYTNTALANNDVVTVVLTANNTCQTAATANGNNITTTVIDNLTPAVTVTSNDADNSICVGTSVTFTAAPTNGGTTPAYQWKLNGTNVGNDATTYTNTALANNDVVTVVLTANNACQTAATANGNNITTTVINNVIPSVTVTSNDADNSICAGTSVTFTAAPTNGGTTPAYQWKLNGTNVGTNATTYSTTTLANNDAVTVVMTANNTCQTASTANGNSIITTVINNVTPSVTINASTLSICPGAGNQVNFTASPVNGGTAPMYQWKVNGVSVGTNSSTYSSTTLSGNDNVKVDMLANNACQTSAMAFSNVLSIVAQTVNTYYVDNDGDGYGNSSTGVSDCSAPVGYVMEGGDCMDSNGDVYPDGFEICNGLDDDCDGISDEDVELTIYYLDNDGDGFGGTSGSIQSCDIPSGYIQQGGDCNDNNASVRPNAPELCATNFDDDCDGLINEICFPGNDNPAFASNCPLSVSTSICNSVTGNLNAATATTIFGSGSFSNNPDVWYYFTANGPGMTIRCTPSVNDIGLELRSSSGELLKSMNALSAVGDEYMNYDDLSVGNQYYLRVMNMSSTTPGGTFTLCAKRIVPPISAFNYTNVYVYNTGCVNVIPTNMSTSVSSTIVLSPLGGGTSYSAAGPTAQLGEFESNSGNGVTYNTVYTGQVHRSFLYPLGNGGTELLTFTTNLTNTLNVLPIIDIDLSSLFVCPTLRSVGSVLRSDRWLCGAVKYQWRFEQYLNGQPYLINGNPVVIELYGNNGSRDIQALASYGFVPGSEWRVKIRPVFPNNVHGDYGTDEQCVKFKGSFAAAPLINEENNEAEWTGKSIIYPNPSNQGMLNIINENWSEVSVSLIIFDAYGREVYEKEFLEVNAIQEDLKALENGVYLVQLSWGNQKEQLHWMIQR